LRTGARTGSSPSCSTSNRTTTSSKSAAAPASRWRTQQERPHSPSALIPPRYPAERPERAVGRGARPERTRPRTAASRFGRLSSRNGREPAAPARASARPHRRGRCAGGSVRRGRRASCSRQVVEARGDGKLGSVVIRDETSGEEIEAGADSPLRHDQRSTDDRGRRGLAPPRRRRLPLHRGVIYSATGRARAARPRAALPPIRPARPLRRRRHPSRLDQARRVRYRRRSDGCRAHPPVLEQPRRLTPPGTRISLTVLDRPRFVGRSTR
jgi:hypothetical protein